MRNYLNITILLFGILVVQHATAQLTRFHWRDYDVNGPVLQISSRMEAPGDTTRIFKPYNDWPCYENAEYAFDMYQGIVMYSYQEEGGLITTRIQKHDHEGINTRYKYTTNKGDSYEEIIDRLPKNRVRVITFDSDTLKSEITYTCDAYYRFMAEESVVKDGSEPDSYHKRTYSTDLYDVLHISDSVFMIENDRLIEVNSTYWDTEWRMTRYVWKLLDPFESVHDQQYFYNEAGQLIKFTNHTDYVYANLEEEIISYNEFGQESERKYYADQQLVNTLTYTYRYDDKGNWIEKHIFLNGVEDSVVKRVITYDQ